MTSTCDFYEDDEPVEDVERAFVSSTRHFLTASPVTFSVSASSNVKITMNGRPLGEDADD